MYGGFYTEEDFKSKGSDNSNLFMFSEEELETKLFPLSPPEVCQYISSLLIYSNIINYLID